MKFKAEIEYTKDLGYVLTVDIEEAKKALPKFESMSKKIFGENATPQGTHIESLRAAIAKAESK